MIATNRGNLAEHLACIRCGYDRFGTPTDAVCPECGARGLTRHYRSRRRLRCGAVAVLLLSAALLAFGGGVRAHFAYRGVELRDFALAGTTQPVAPQTVYVAAYLGLMIGSTNALCTGGLLGVIISLASFVASACLRERRAMWLLLIALLGFAAAMYLGLQQSTVLE